MKHFHSKSIAFYLITIVFVGLLFRVVVQYGETNLSAPINISGRYVSDRPLPGCSEPFAIELQQSGIYVNGRIIETATAAALTGEKLALSGLWRSSQLTISGTTAIDCAASPLAELHGAFKQTTLDGQLRLGETESLGFLAQREPDAASTTPTAH